MRRFTAVRPGVTEHNCPLPVGSPKGWLSPWLQMGTAANQNLYGNLHNHNGSTTGPTPSAVSMALSTLGNTYTGNTAAFTATISGTTMTVSAVSSGTLALGMAIHWPGWNSLLTQTATITAFGTGSGGTGTYTISVSHTVGTSTAMTANDRYLSTGGTPLFERVADPTDAAKYCYAMRLAYNDQRPSSQADNSGGNPGLRKSLARFGDDGSSPSAGQGTLGSRHVYYMDAFSFYVPAATRDIAKKADQILIWQHKNSTGAPAATINMYSRVYSDSFALGAGTGPRLAFKSRSGRLAQSYQTILLDNYPADTWLHFIVRILPSYNSGGVVPSNEVWLAVGSAAWTKVINTTNENLDADADSINRQWGWYLPQDGSWTTNDVSSFPTLNDFWTAGDVLTTYWKDYTVFPQDLANQAPTNAQLDQWFALMRQR